VPAITGCFDGEAAMALTFDDDFIEQWHDQRALFDDYDVHATFLVTRFDQLTDEQLRWLHDLEQDGHEIGCHSLTHVDPDIFLEDHTVPEYVDAEIVPAIELMQAQGFDPRSFSFPWGSHDDELDAALSPYFEILRTSGTLDEPADALYRWSGDTVLAAGRIDEGHYTMDQLDDAIGLARQRGDALVVYTHRIMGSTDRSHITPDQLEEVLAAAARADLAFGTLSDLTSEGSE
jgi:peptidoglycan/xylan/chitin deacetylase (PgdA/CDA1 family)